MPVGKIMRLLYSQDMDHVTYLKNNNKIELLEPLRRVKEHHHLRCLTCGYAWFATPLSKVQTHKKYGVSGCPKCKKKRQQARLEEIQQQTKQKLEKLGLDVLSEWDGSYYINKQSTEITVRNKTCGHTFTSLVKNILTRNVTCSVCGAEERAQQLTQTVRKRSEEWQKTASEWQLYKSTVASLTRLAYNKHKEIINPQNLLRGKAGVDGAHHIDHIVPIRYCFEHNIPETVCAHPDNLQMLGWRENVGSRDKLKPNRIIPKILQEYIDN